MRRVIELTRYVVALPAIGAIIGAMVLMVIGLIDIGRSVLQLFTPQVEMKESVISVLAAVDTLLLATVLLVIGYGLYELFVDDSLDLPAWLEIKTLDDLKGKLIGVVVAIIAVIFLGFLADAKDAASVMPVGIGAGAILVGLAAFTFASRK
ncbi:MAG: YqhA family protein [Actinomycetales bacterium]